MKDFQLKYIAVLLDDLDSRRDSELTDEGHPSVNNRTPKIPENSCSESASGVFFAGNPCLLDAKAMVFQTFPRLNLVNRRNDVHSGCKNPRLSGRFPINQSIHGMFMSKSCLSSTFNQTFNQNHSFW